MPRSRARPHSERRADRSDARRSPAARRRQIRARPRARHRSWSACARWRSACRRSRSGRGGRGPARPRGRRPRRCWGAWRRWRRAWARCSRCRSGGPRRALRGRVLGLLSCLAGTGCGWRRWRGARAFTPPSRPPPLFPPPQPRPLAPRPAPPSPLAPPRCRAARPSQSKARVVPRCRASIGGPQRPAWPAPAHWWPEQGKGAASAGRRRVRAAAEQAGPPRGPQRAPGPRRPLRQLAAAADGRACGAAQVSPRRRCPRPPPSPTGGALRQPLLSREPPADAPEGGSPPVYVELPWRPYGSAAQAGERVAARVAALERGAARLVRAAASWGPASCGPVQRAATARLGGLRKCKKQWHPCVTGLRLSTGRLQPTQPSSLSRKTECDMVCRRGLLPRAAPVTES